MHRAFALLIIAVALVSSQLTSCNASQSYSLTKLWAYTVPPRNEYGEPVICDGDGDGFLDIFWSSGDIAYVLRGSTGELLWKQRIPGLKGMTTACLIDGSLDRMIIASETGNVCALDFTKPGKDKIAWGPKKLGRSQSFIKAPAGGNITSASGGEVILASRHSLFVINCTTGSYTQVLSKNTQRIENSPALCDLDGDGFLDVIVGMADGTVCAYSIQNRRILWNYECGGKVLSSAAFAQVNSDGVPDIVIGSNDNKVHLIDGQTGEKIDTYDTGSAVVASPVVAQFYVPGSSQVGVGSRDNRLFYFFNLVTGMDDSPSIFDTDGIITHAAAPADLNNDGITDAVIISREKIYARNCNTSSVIWQFQMKNPESTAGLADLNNDGLLDVIFADESEIIVLSTKQKVEEGEILWLGYGGNSARQNNEQMVMPQLSATSSRMRRMRKLIGSAKDSLAQAKQGFQDLLKEPGSVGDYKIEAVLVQLNKAKDSYRRVLQENPDSLVAAETLTLCDTELEYVPKVFEAIGLIKLAKYEKALKLCEDCLRLKPGDIEANYWRSLAQGYTGLTNGKWADAGCSFKDCLRYKESNAEAGYWMNFCYGKDAGRKEEWKVAVEYFKKAEESAISPEGREGVRQEEFFAEGSKCMKESRWEDAKDAFKECTGTGTHERKVNYSLNVEIPYQVSLGVAKGYRNEKKWIEARDGYQRCLAIKRDGREVADGLDEVAKEIGSIEDDFKRAERHLGDENWRNAVILLEGILYEKDPKHSVKNREEIEVLLLEGYYNRALKESDREKKRKFLKKVLDIDASLKRSQFPQDNQQMVAVARNLLVDLEMEAGLEFLKNGKWQKALECFRWILKENPSYDRIKVVYLKTWILVHRLRIVAAFFGLGLLGFFLRRGLRELRGRKAIEVGDEYYRQGELGKAEREYSLAYEYLSENNISSRKLAGIWLELGKVDEQAIELYVKILPYLPDNHRESALMVISEYYAVDTTFDRDMRRMVNQMLAVEPGNIQVQLLYARLMQSSGKAESALKVCDEVMAGEAVRDFPKVFEHISSICSEILRYDPGNWYALCILAASCMNQGDFANAGKILRNLHKDNPGNTKIFQQLVVCLTEQKDTSHYALEIYRDFLKVKPEGSEETRGEILRRILSCAPHCKEALFELSGMELHDGRIHEAVEHFTEYCRLSPDAKDISGILTSLGNVASKNPSIIQTVTDGLRQLLEVVGRSNPLINKEIAKLELQQGNISESMHHYRIAAAEGAEGMQDVLLQLGAAIQKRYEPDLHFQFADLCWALGQDQAALESIVGVYDLNLNDLELRENVIKTYTKMLGEKPEQVDLLSRLAQVLMDAARYGEAAGYLQRVRKVVNSGSVSVASADGDRTKNTTMLAYCYSKAGMDYSAKTMFERCLAEQQEVNDESKIAYYLYGRYKEDIGEMDEALELYEKVAMWDYGYNRVGEHIQDIRVKSRFGSPTLERYERLKQIGDGEWGVVWRAKDRQLPKAEEVALKVLRMSLHRDPVAIERFKRGADVGSRLSHPGVVKILGYQEEQGRHMIIMELIRGRDLGEIIDTNGPMSEDEFVDLALKVCEPLKYLHSQEVIHRDIKPTNIMVTEVGNEVKLTDIELAKPLGSGRYIDTTGFPGTPMYASPEQFRKEKDIDYRTDIYSFGATLYYVLTGSVIFPDEEGYHCDQLRNYVCDTMPKAPSEREATISEELSDIVMKCLRKSREERFESVKEIINALRSFTLGREPTMEVGEDSVFGGKTTT